MATPGVTKEVTKGGDNTNFPEKGDEVTMEYTGTDPLPPVHVTVGPVSDSDVTQAGSMTKMPKTRKENSKKLHRYIRGVPPE